MSILFDCAPQQRRRWLLRNSPIISIAVGIILTWLYVNDLTIRLGAIGFGLICLGIILWGAFFKRLLINRDTRQITCQYRFFGWFVTREITRPFADCSHVLYSVWFVPRINRQVWFGAIYLHFHVGKPWRISDEGNFSMDLECDEAMAQQLADALAIPLQKDQQDPLL